MGRGCGYWPVAAMAWHGIPDARTLSGTGLDLSASKTDGQYGTGMVLAPSPDEVPEDEILSHELGSGMGLVPSLSYTGRQYWTGMGPGPSPTRSYGRGCH
jgi:hypothetical protein